MPTFEVRPPFTPGRFMPLAPGSIRIHGALREKLTVLRDGLLSSFVGQKPEAGLESQWYGGNLNADCSVPAYLEAQLLTAALLGDRGLRQKVLDSVYRIVSLQRDDGCVGPEQASFQARGKMLRVLTLAYDMIGDRPILIALLRHFKYLREQLKTAPLSPEDSLHTADTLAAGIHFYNVTGQKAVLSVLERLIQQSAPYTQLFHAFPYHLPVSRIVPAEDLMRGLSGETDDGYYHGILRMSNAENLCEGLRTSGLSGVVTGSGKHISAPEAGLAKMRKAHGAACGSITSEPLLAGTRPSAGISLRASAELAFSLETLLCCSGSFHAADQLETVFYNAILGALNAEGTAVQPVQQSNQVSLPEIAPYPLMAGNVAQFSASDPDAVLALLNAVPRFASSQWLLAADGGIAAAGYASCRVQTSVGKTAVRIDVRGGYPYDDTVQITLSMDGNAAFPLHLRIPQWSQGASAAVQGDLYTPRTEEEYLTITREWHDGDTVLLHLPMQTQLNTGYHQAVSVTRGPVCYVYVPGVDPVSSDESGRRAAGTGAAVLRDSSFEPVYGKKGVSLKAKVYPLSGWRIQDGTLEQPPIDLPEPDPALVEETLLQPYADCPLRIAVFPAI